MMPALTHIPVLETERLVLRAPQASDLNAFTCYATSARTRYVGGPVTPAGAAQKFATMIGQWVLRGFGRFTITRRDTGAPIGHAGPFQMDAEAAPELTWSLWDLRFEGQGFASEAAQATADWVFGSLCLPRATTIIHRQNLASERIAMRLGGHATDETPAEFGPDFRYWQFIPARRVA